MDKSRAQFLVKLALSHQWVPLGESFIVCLRLCHGVAGLKKGAVHFPPWWMEALEKQLRSHWGSSPPASLLNCSPWKLALSWTAPDIIKRWSPMKYSFLTLTLGWLACPTLFLPISFFHGGMGLSCTFGTPARGYFFLCFFVLLLFVCSSCLGVRGQAWFSPQQITAVKEATSGSKAVPERGMMGPPMLPAHSPLSHIASDDRPWQERPPQRGRSLFLWLGLRVAAGGVERR